MISLAEGVAEIFSDTPKSFYIFSGPDYGVKLQYIEKLRDLYHQEIEYYDTVDAVLTQFKSKSLFSRIPKVYVVRYDKLFVTSDYNESSISKINICGTIILLIDSDSDESKLDKRFPNNVLRVNHLSKSIELNHLKKKFNLEDKYLKYVVNISEDYYQSILIASDLTFLDTRILNSLSFSDIKFLFGYQDNSSSSDFKEAIVSRNFKKMMNHLDSYEFDENTAIYDILSAYLELIKCFQSRNTYDFSKYTELWSLEEVKIAFSIAYDQLTKQRTNSKYSLKSAILYLCCMTQYHLN